jgi:hypothetical protein
MTFASDLKCYPAANMNFKYKNRVHSLKKRFCVDPPEKFLINEECSKKSDCMAMKTQTLPLPVVQEKLQIGSPGHRVCQVIKGNPIIVKYKTTGPAWKETSICLFADESFVNIDYLLNYIIRTN